jgi:hypothetical protein
MPLDAAEVKRRMNGFYSGDLNHHNPAKQYLGLLPEDARKLYEIIFSQTYARRQREYAAVA